MKILVDADACPVRAEVLEAARARGVHVLFVASVCHDIAVPCDGVELLLVDNEADAADWAILGRCEPGDIVVTGDHGLASLVLVRRARALSPRGRIYTESQVDSMLAARHAARRARRGGTRRPGPKAMTDADRAAFRHALEELLAG